jgi:molybdopterin-binding protein
MLPSPWPTLDRVNTPNFRQNGDAAMLSARNQLPAVVKSVKLGNVMAEVVMEAAGAEIVSSITRGSAEALKLQVGDRVTAVIKATEVLIDKS